MQDHNLEFDTVSELLHKHFDETFVPVELRQRINSILNVGHSSVPNETPGSQGLPSRRVRAVNRWQLRATFATVAAVAVLILGSVIVTHAFKPDSPKSAASPLSLAGLSNIDACDMPDGPFAHFYIFDRDGSGDAIYQGKVKVGAALVPTSSIYASHGAIGSGYLCLSNTVGPGRAVPVQAVLAARTGALTYVGLFDGDQPWGAVAPGITSVSVQTSGQPADVYTLNGTADHLLRPLDAKWHSFNSPGGFSGTGSVTLTITAYAGQTVMDKKTLSTATAQSSSSVPQPTR